MLHSCSWVVKCTVCHNGGNASSSCSTASYNDIVLGHKCTKREVEEPIDNSADLFDEAEAKNKSQENVEPIKGTVN